MYNNIIIKTYRMSIRTFSKAYSAYCMTDVEIYQKSPPEAGPPFPPEADPPWAEAEKPARVVMV